MKSESNLIRFFEKLPPQPIEVLQCMIFFPFLIGLHHCNRLSHKLLSLSGLLYKDLITAMSELQKCEKSAKKLKNKIDSLLFSDLTAEPLTSSSPGEEILSPEKFTSYNETSPPVTSPPKNFLLQESAVGNSTSSSLKPSQLFIRKFFEYLPLRVNDISIPLTKQKVRQYFHPSPLTGLISPVEDSKQDHEMNELLFPLECSLEALPSIHLRAQNLFSLITTWDHSQWITNHPNLPILSIQDTNEGPLLQLNPAFICQLVSEIYGWQNLPPPLSVEKYLQFLTANALDSPSFLIVMYLYHSSAALSNAIETGFPSSHMAFIDWLNSLLSHDSQSLLNLFQEEPVFLIKDVPVPPEIHSFLLHCMNGTLSALPSPF